MSMKGGNFWTAHYEWIVVGVALAILAAGVILFAGALHMDGDALAQEAKDGIKCVKPAGDPVGKANLAEYEVVLKAAQKPDRIAELNGKDGSCLSPERRIVCEKCKAVVSAAPKACPACGFARKEEEKVVVDADQDGLPDEWEKLHGLNAGDPQDAAADKDGDGFTNAEEFAAKTDPSDRKSHPDYLDYVKLQLPLKQTSLSFYFTGTYKTPSGLKFQFKDPTKSKEYDRGVYSVLAGEMIGKSGFSAKAYVPKSEKRKMGGGMEKKVDVSEAVVVRKSDGKTVSMTINRKQVPVDIQATLAFERGENKTFSVVPGDSLDLYGEKYVVKAISQKGKSASVVLEHEKLGRTREIQALEP